MELYADSSGIIQGIKPLLSAVRKDKQIPYKSLFHFIKAFKVLQSLRDDRSLCDIELETDDGKLVSGHKLILASASPYFQAMFTRFHESDKDRVSLKEMDSYALRLLIDYIYTGEIVVSDENVQVLLPAASVLQLDDVRYACCKLLHSQLHPTNCLGIKAFAELHGCTELSTSTETYINQHFGDVVKGDEFLSLSGEQVVKLITSQELNMPSEQKVFDCVILWVNHDPVCRKDYLPKLLKLVHLQLISANYVLKMVEEEPILKNSYECKKYITEALKYKQFESEPHCSIPKTICSKYRQPVRLPEVILVIGGATYKESRIVEWYDPVSNQWDFGPKMKTKCLGAGLAVLDDCVYALGGINDITTHLNTVNKLDLTTSYWVPSVPMLKKRSFLGVAVLNNCVYAVGGHDGVKQLNSAEVFDCSTQSWSMISNMSTKRYRLGVGVLNNILYAVGGYDVPSRQSLNSVECYDPRTDKWTPVAEMRERRRGAGVGVLDGVIYAVGGWNRTGYLKSVEAYSPSVGVWTSVVDMHMCHSDAGVVALDGLLYVVSGNNQYSVEVYDPKTNTWYILSTSMKTNRSDVKAVLIKYPRLLINWNTDW